MAPIGRRLEGHPSCLSLFTSRPVQTAIKRTELVDYGPTAPIVAGSPISFSVPETGVEYLDISRTRLYVKIKIIKQGGGDVDVTDKVAFTNLPIHGIWSQCDLSLGGKVITADVATFYGQKAMMDVLLQYVIIY